MSIYLYTLAALSVFHAPEIEHVLYIIAFILNTTEIHRSSLFFRQSFMYEK